MTETQDQVVNTAKNKPTILHILLPTVVLLGSFLMFVLEPLTGKIVTPRFGGTAAVWSTCLTFFQLAVLCGYSLTYFLSKLSFKQYLSCYALIVLCSLLWMRLPVPDQWRPSGSGDPVWQLLYMLIVHVGIPSVLLCSISGTMQVWYRNMNLGNPYPLYSVSNLGSLAALLAYPLLMEPALTVTGTMWWWGGGYFLLIAGILASAWIAREKAIFAPHLEDNSLPSQRQPSLQGSAPSTPSPVPATSQAPVCSITEKTESTIIELNSLLDPASPSKEIPEPLAAGQQEQSNLDENQLDKEQDIEISSGGADLHESASTFNADPRHIDNSEIRAQKKGKRKKNKGHAAAGQLSPAESNARSGTLAPDSGATTGSDTIVGPSADTEDRAGAPTATVTDLTSAIAPKAGDSLNENEDRAKPSSGLLLPPPPKEKDPEKPEGKPEREPVLPPSSPLRSTDKTSVKEVVVWVGLSMIGSLVLLTHTAYLTSDIAPVPLLWIAPLALYLITFILVFASPIFYRPMLFIYCWPVLTIVEIALGQQNIAIRLGINLASVFILCMICHGEMAAAKPPASRLPTYWLCTSIGGVLGGLLVSVVAPLVFDFDLERLITYALMVGVSYLAVVKRQLFIFGYKPVSYGWVGWSSTALLILLIGDTLMTDEYLHRERNFYGCVQVHQTRGEPTRSLVNGQILHGEQDLRPRYEMVPLSYYQLCIAFVDTYLRWRSHGAHQNYAVIGLGVGTVAAYGRKGDNIDFFEIDPKIKKLALKYFTYLSKSKGNVNVLMGDARASFQKLDSSKLYDLIVVDAFNGDAIPLHLITIEAMKEYLTHLKPDGLLLFHVSNRYINLAPPVSATARKLGMHPLAMDDHFSYYVLLTHTEKDIVSLKDCLEENKKSLEEHLTLKDIPPTSVKEWTDDFANLASFFKFVH